MRKLELGKALGVTVEQLEERDRVRKQEEELKRQQADKQAWNGFNGLLPNSWQGGTVVINAVGTGTVSNVLVTGSATGTYMTDIMIDNVTMSTFRWDYQTGKWVVQ